MNYKELFLNLGKMILAGVITFVVCMLVAAGFDKGVHLPKALFEILKISVVGVVCLGLYTGLNLAFRMEYAVELAQRLKNKLHK